MKKIFLGLSILAAVVLGGCNKESNSSNVDVAKYTPVHRTANLNGRQPDNSNNPYDYAGALHNDYVDVMKAYLIENENATTQDVADYFENWVATNTEYTVDLSDIEDKLDAAIHYEDADASIQAYISSLDVIISNIPTYASYSAYKADIVSLESTVINSAALSNSQKEIILGSASIARYSGAYWWDFVPETSADTDNRSDVVNADKAGYHEWGGDWMGIIVGGAYSTARALDDLRQWWRG